MAGFEPEARLVRPAELPRHSAGVAMPGYDQGRVRSGHPEHRAPCETQPRGVHALAYQQLHIGSLEFGIHRFKFRQQFIAQGLLDTALLERAHLRHAHAVGGQYTGQGVQEDLFHAQCVCHLAGMLSRRAAEAA